MFGGEFMDSISSKVAHVRAAMASHKPADHLCHWPGCSKPVAPAAWGCRSHWYQLPIELRHEIWRTYRPRQEISKTPKSDYIAAARKVAAWITSNEAQAVVKHSQLNFFD
jgi:hypothetical protein